MWQVRAQTPKPLSVYLYLNVTKIDRLHHFGYHYIGLFLLSENRVQRARLYKGLYVPHTIAMTT